MSSRLVGWKELGRRKLNRRKVTGENEDCSSLVSWREMSRRKLNRRKVRGRKTNRRNKQKDSKQEVIKEEESEQGK